MPGQLEGKVAVVTGSSRGLGRAMAVTFAREGAKVAILARTEEPHPRIGGTILQTAQAIQDAGGVALPLRCNVASPEDIEAAVQRAGSELGRIDILVHNAAANFPGGVSDLAPQRWDLLFNVNPRALFLLTKAALPALEARGGHVISVSPGASDSFRGGVYFLSKQTQTRLALGMAEEFKDKGIGVNCLWPEGQRSSEGTMMMYGGFQPGMLDPQVFADAALAIVTKDPRQHTGHTLSDLEVLRHEGVTDFSHYESQPQA